MKSIVMLSGPVGAGKTTVARELLAVSTGPTAYIEGDKFWFFIAKDGASRGMHKNFRMIMTAMVAAAVPYALNEYEVILDFSVPPWFLGTARKIAGRKEVPLDFVVLRPSETVCAARAAARVEGAIEDYARYSELYASFDEAGSHILCDDEGSAASVAGRIREGLDRGVYRLEAS